VRQELWRDAAQVTQWDWLASEAEWKRQPAGRYVTVAYATRRLRAHAAGEGRS